MRFVADQEHNVCGYFASRLVALLLERHLGARLPARLDRNAHILVLLLGAAVRLDDAPRDFHLFHAALVDLLQRGIQVVLDGRVLCLFLLERGVHVERV